MNAGVRIEGISIASFLSNEISLGVIIGLLSINAPNDVNLARAKLMNLS